MFALNLKWERGSAELRNIFWLFSWYQRRNLRIKGPERKLNLDRKQDYKFQKYCTIFLSKRCSKKSKRQGLVIDFSTRELICQFCLFRFSILQPNIYKIYKKTTHEWTILCVPKKFHVKNFEMQKWLILFNNTSKQLQKFPISPDKHKDFWLLNERKRKLHKFGQKIVNNFHNLNLKFHNLIFRACVKFDDWGAVVCRIERKSDVWLLT